MLLLTASNENLKRVIELLSAESVYHLLEYVKQNQVLKQTRKSLSNFDFIYQYFAEYNLVVITAYKKKYDVDFNYGETSAEIFEINKLCNEYLDLNREI